MKKLISTAVVGASGMVGGELLFLLEERGFPVGRFLPFSSGKKSAKVRFKGKNYKCLKPSLALLKTADIVFFVSNEDPSLRFAKKLAGNGAWCIDDSSAFRMDPAVPLIIPEVNSGELSPASKLIAGPNCTISGIALAAYPLRLKFGIKNLRLATYQSVSGAGRKAILQFGNELKAWMTGKTPSAKSRVLPQPIAFNLFPHVGNFDSAGNSGEEIKIERELRKIWNAPDLKVSSTAVRVPIIRGHSVSAWIETGKNCPTAEAERLIRQMPGVKFYKTTAKNPTYPTPMGSPRTLDVMAGRLRKSSTSPNELQLWVVSDNLYKGAALNSIQIAEFLLKKGWL